VAKVVEAFVAVDEEVDEEHDAKTRDVTMRQGSAIQINLLFIQTSFYL